MLKQGALIRVTQNLMQELLQPGIELVDFFQYVLDQTLGLLEFDVGWLLLKDGDWVEIVAADQRHADDVGRRFLINDCLSGQSMLRRDAINVPNLATMPEEFKHIYKSPSGRAMRSELVFPLLIGDEPIGAFNIESDRQGAFEARHLEALRLLSGHVAVAVALARSRQEAAALSSVGLDLSRQTEMDAVVRSVLAHALAMVQGEYGQVLLREGDQLAVRFTTNRPPVDLDLTVDVNDSICGLALQERKPIIVPDVATPDYLVVNLMPGETGWKGDLVRRATVRPRYKRALETDKSGMHAEYAVPLWSGDAIIGVLNVETPRQSGFTSQQRRDLLEFVRLNADRCIEGLSSLNPELLMDLLHQALAGVDTTFGQILRPDEDDLIIEQTTGSEPIGTRVAVHKSVTGRALRAETPHYVADVAQDPDYQRYLGEEMKSELAVPLIIGDQAIGVLNIESAIPAAFTLDHARILEAFAGQAAVAIDRTRRFESQKLAEMGSLAGDIVHRLNNPLGAIGMQIDLLKRKPFYAEASTRYPYLEQFVERVRGDLSAAKTTIQELRSAAHGRNTRLTPMPLKTAIDEALHRAGLGEDVQVKMLLPDETLRVMANDRLANVFWNLFDNARKAMARGGSLVVAADAADDDRCVIVRVRDAGQGIEPWRLDSIFEPEEATPGDPYAPAHGLGLWWTRAQVESFGGDISVESEPGVGTCVTLRLRRALG
ncbi:MAG: GAF domain-containing sensor histidine kinase [Ardenticatenia bacterium]|nr:GAF domain-containing sensor histidine kinase [Ardenticatenia bacterium]